MDVIRTLSPDDAMVQGNPQHYFAAGESALRIIIDAIAVAGASSPQSILDFGSGAGRVTRWLKAAFPDSGIYCCDIRPQDMAFLRSSLGVAARTVGVDVEGLRIGGRYDLVWAGSVITHMPQGIATTLIKKLLAACRSGGLLILSFHGQRAIERQDGSSYRYIHDEAWEVIRRDYFATGYGYADYELQQNYGISVCSPAWMSAFVSALPGARLVQLRQQAWDNHHDVVVIQKTAAEHAGWLTPIVRLAEQLRGRLLGNNASRTSLAVRCQ